MRWRRRSREHDLDRELRVHLELETEEQLNSGLTQEEARHAARRAFGNVTYLKEEVRRIWSWTAWDVFIQDLRYALRSLRKSPGFAVTAILTLAFGIGASTAVFTAIDSVLLRPLGYRDSGTLVVAWEHVPWLGGDPVGPNPRHADVWQKRAKSFSGLTLFLHAPRGLSLGGGHPELIGTVSCLPNLFNILGIQPSLGRGFMPEDGMEGHNTVAILTYAAWQTLFHGDPGAIGKTVRIEDTPIQVIGVLPAGFHFPNANALRAFRSNQPKSEVPEPAVFLPALLDLSQMDWNGNYGNWITLGRLKPDVSLREAETQLNAIQAQILQEIPGGRRDNASALRASLQPMREAVVSDARTGLWLLMIAVTGLMLIACLNLANAQFGRALTRRRDAGIRIALGAAKGRLIWNALAENSILTAVGGAAGILLAHAGLNLFRRYSPVDLPRLSEIHLNLTVLLFSLGLTIAATLLSGLLPTVRLLSIDPHTCLQQNSTRAMGSKSGHRISTFLIGLQVFGCTALLLATGLFSKSLLHLMRQDKGFQTEHVAVAEIRLPSKLYSTEDSRIGFMDAVLQNLRDIPGVQAAGLVSAMPLEGESWIEPLQRVDRPDQEGPLVNARWVSPGYFEATHQRLVAGRFFGERDRNLNSVVVSEGEAKALWRTENPIGSQVSILDRIHTVIGIVADSRTTSLKMAPSRVAYVHYKYRPPYTTFFLVRGMQSAVELVSAERQAIWKNASNATIARVKTLDSQLSDSLAPERFQTLVLITFGIAALLLAMIGIYGVLSHSVAARKQEIGVRIALGATRSRVYALTLAQAGAPVLVGLATGLFASLLAGRLIRNMLYGVQVLDPSVMVIVTGLFLLSAVTAAFLPARRAACVDPMDALRSE